MPNWLRRWKISNASSKETSTIGRPSFLWNERIHFRKHVVPSLGNKPHRKPRHALQNNLNKDSPCFKMLMSTKAETV